MTERDIPPGGEGPDPASVDDQITQLVDTVGALLDQLRQLRGRVDALEAPEGRLQRAEPGPWVLYSPPAAAEDPRHRDQDPRFTVDNFVGWYNATYVGVSGTATPLIPDCWREHPGLAMEIATLAYSWRHANIGRAADPRDAQHWHHHTRPGFADRLVRDWVHPHCRDGRHRAVGAAARPDRFTPPQQHPRSAEPSPPAENRQA